MLAILTTTKTDMEASLVMGRLSEAGIPCMHSDEGARTRAFAGPGSILVEHEDLERARAVLRSDEGGFDEAELARLSEEAGLKLNATEQERSQAQPPSTNAQDASPPTPTSTETDQHRLRNAMEKLTGRQGKHPGNPFGH